MNFPSKQSWKTAGTIVLVVALLAIAVDCLDGFQQLELRTLDFRAQYNRKETRLPDDIAVILIDEASLDAIGDLHGSWPWPRKIHADLIEFLSLCNAKAVVMDVLFTENERNNGVEELGAGDRQLVESTRSAGNVFHSGHMVRDVVDEYNDTLLSRPIPDDFIDKFAVDVNLETQAASYNNHYLPFFHLSNASRGIGIVTFTSDPDGAYRRERLLFQYHGNSYPSLGLVPALWLFDIHSARLDHRTLTLSNDVRAWEIPVQKDLNYFVNMYGRYPTYSFSGVYLSMMKIKFGELENLPVAPDEFRDKIVFVGASAAGVEDLKSTTMGPRMPGVFLHASVFANILQDDFILFPPPWMDFLITTVLLSFSVWLIFYLKLLRNKVLASLLILGGYPVTALYLYKTNMAIPFVMPVASVLLGYLVSITYLTFKEGRDRRKVKNVLGQYVSPSVLTTVMAGSKDGYLKAEVGSREDLTLFFSDIRGFTSFAEAHPPEKVVETLNVYLSEMVDIIFDHQGTLDKFIGDAIVAFWGAPLHDPDHHYKAVASAIEMMNALDELNERNLKRSLPSLNIGIGIHSGDAILGNIGSKKKLDYTVIGDTVNLASRIEGLTKVYNCPILISQDTQRHIKDRICCRMVDYVKVKGRGEPVSIYQVMGHWPEIPDEEKQIVALAAHGFKQYRAGDFRSAIGTFNEILEISPHDFIGQMFIYRCETYLKSPPPDGWDGYYEYLNK